MVVGSPPTVKRRQLARELRRLREEAGMRGDELATELRSSLSRISRIETARIRIGPGLVHEICDVLDIHDERRARLVRLARKAEEPGWWQEYGTLTYEYSTYIAMESEAAALRCFEQLVVPGLLQTADYARAVIRKTLMEATTQDVDERVAVRLARQEVLAREPDPVRLCCVLDEAALRRAVGGPGVMRAQLHRILELVELPSVRLQVIPFDAGAHTCSTGPFTIIEFPETTDSDAVYVENAAGDLYVEKQPGVRRYTLMFDDLRADALGHDESAALVAKIADEL